MSRQLYLPNSTAPDCLETPLCLIERQTLDHNAADYAAVMSAREHLRAWSASEWPEHSFTLEQNREDLAGHIQDAADAIAFGYTVFDRNRTAVLGSVYLYSIAWFAPLQPAKPHQASRNGCPPGQSKNRCPPGQWKSIR